MRLSAEHDSAAVETPLAIITWGPMLYRALEAADRLAESGHSASVLDLRWLRPLDDMAIDEAVRESGGRVIVAHEANLTGGFGAEIAARVNERHFRDLFAPVRRVAALDMRFPLPPHCSERSSRAFRQSSMQLPLFLIRLFRHSSPRGAPRRRGQRLSKEAHDMDFLVHIVIRLPDSMEADTLTRLREAEAARAADLGDSGVLYGSGESAGAGRIGVCGPRVTKLTWTPPSGRYRFGHGWM